MTNKIIFSNKKYNVIILVIFFILFVIVFGLNYINLSYDDQLQSLYNLEENRIILLTYDNGLYFDEYKDYIDDVEILYKNSDLPQEFRVIIKQNINVTKVLKLFKDDGFNAVLQYSETENDILQLKEAKNSFMYYYYFILFIVIIIFVLIVISSLKNDAEINSLLYAIGYSKLKVYFINFCKYLVFMSLPFIIISVLSLLIGVSLVKLISIFILELAILSIILIKNNSNTFWSCKKCQ